MSVSNLAYPSIVVVLFSSSVFVSSSVCLCRLCSECLRDGKLFSPVSGFQLLVLRVFCWSSSGFFFRAPLLSFLHLGCSCLVGVLCVPCSSLLSILLVTVFSVFNCSFFILCRFPVLFLSLPLSLWFCSCSSPASSSSSVPCRRVLLVCLQLRLRRRRDILLPFPLLWLLPLRLLLGFHLLLLFSGILLLLAGFRCGLVVPARRFF